MPNINIQFENKTFNQLVDIIKQQSQIINNLRTKKKASKIFIENTRTGLATLGTDTIFYDVILVSYGEFKIKVIKALREHNI